MKRLGYTRFVAQGGDWGNAVTEQMALLAPPELLGIHTNMPATIPDDADRAKHFLKRAKGVHMKATRMMAVAVLVVASGLALYTHVARARQAGVKRTDLQRHDLSAPGREVIQVRVDIEPGGVAPRHRHPGEEIIYVLEGSLEYEVEGKSPVTLKTGDVLFIPAGTIHAAKNISSANGAELATYVVEKGKPLVVPAE